jgi:AAA+ superfamily predicted ATPase
MSDDKKVKPQDARKGSKGLPDKDGGASLGVTPGVKAPGRGSKKPFQERPDPVGTEAAFPADVGPEVAPEAPDGTLAPEANGLSLEAEAGLVMASQPTDEPPSARVAPGKVAALALTTTQRILADAGDAHLTILKDMGAALRGVLAPKRQTRHAAAVGLAAELALRGLPGAQVTIAIVGPKNSGKEQLAKLLAHALKATPGYGNFPPNASCPDLGGWWDKKRKERKDNRLSVILRVGAVEQVLIRQAVQMKGGVKIFLIDTDLAKREPLDEWVLDRCDHVICLDGLPPRAVAALMGKAAHLCPRLNQSLWARPLDGTWLKEAKVLALGSRAPLGTVIGSMVDASQKVNVAVRATHGREPIPGPLAQAQDGQSMDREWCRAFGEALAMRGFPVRKGDLGRNRSELHGMKDAYRKDTAYFETRTPAFGLDDVILADATRRQVESFLRAVRNRGAVSDWGVKPWLLDRMTTIALFHGESGTGKTMAAEAIAKELDLKLHVVNAVSLVGRYIGDSEHFIDDFFRAASKTEGVFLLDEADTLMWNRQDTSDNCQDYYASIINTFMRWLETYRGILIMTSNLAARTDPAVERRISHKVLFGKPDAPMRQRIWEGLWSEGIPLEGELRWAELAERHRLSGGLIRNAFIEALRMAGDHGAMTQGIMDEACRWAAESTIREGTSKSMGFRTGSPRA